MKLHVAKGKMEVNQLLRNQEHLCTRNKECTCMYCVKQRLHDATGMGVRWCQERGWHFLLSTPSGSLLPF